MNITIRSYVNEDYLAVKANLEATGLYDSELDKPSRLQKMINDWPEAILVAANENGEVVGNVYMSRDYFKPYIGRLAVALAYQSQGIGKQLLVAAEQSMQKQKRDRVFLIVDEEKPELTHYYSNNGYIKRGNGIVMMKEFK